MALEPFEQRSIEPHQGIGIELLARLAKGRRSHRFSQRLDMEDLEEATKLVANAALAQIQQHGDEVGVAGAIVGG